MTMNRTRTLLVAAAVGALALTACSSQTPVAEPSSTAAPSSTAEGDPGDVTTITFWDFIDPTQDNPRSKALKENVANFEAENPDVKVNLEVVGSADMIARLPQAAAAGGLPDVIKIFQPWVPQMIDAGVYQSLEPFVGEVDQNDWIQPWTGTVWDGKKMVMPYEYRSDVLIYNKAILTELGLNVPETWPEVLEVAKAATAAGYTGFGTGFSTGDNASIISESYDAYMAQTGQEIVDESGELTIDNEASESFFQLYRDLIDANVLGAGVVDGTYSTVYDGLQNGTIAMSLLGSHRVVNLQSANPDISWAPLPGIEAGDHTSNAMGWTLGIGASSTGAQAEAAWRFIDYMTSPEGQTIMAQGGEVPARLSAYDDEYFSSDAAAIVLGFRDNLIEWGNSRAYPTNWIPLSYAVAIGTQQLYLNGATPADALQATLAELD